jgi:hypothetical protein
VLRVVGVAAGDEKVPVEGRGSMVPGIFDELEDMAVTIVRARVGLVDLLWFPAGVMGHYGVYFAGYRVDLYTLGTVHLGRPQ